MANLGRWRERAEVLEFEIQQAPLDIVEAILARAPRIVGFGVYIWNVRPTTEVVALLKRLRPELRIVVGGPEVSHEWDDQEIVRLADHLITGEADLAFAVLCEALLAGGAGEPGVVSPPWARGSAPPRVLHAALPDLGQLTLPYALYSDADLAHRVLYVEASRGCPFSCEFCLSSLDVPVRTFPVDAFLASMQSLLDRGARQFKFVDRTFNLSLEVGRRILGFFRERWREGLFLHFEMIPDRLPEALREAIRQFPPGALQFEIGIQSFQPEVCARIQRRQDAVRTADNLRFLRDETGVHVHADLIVGLPGEGLAGFAEGFDRLVALNPQEIQVGILKRLRGTPIGRHDEEWGMRYSPGPPYEILESRLLDFATLQRLRRFARYWDILANSGRWVATRPLFWAGGGSPFACFLALSDWLFAQVRRTHAVAADRLIVLLFRWLVEERRLDPWEVGQALAADWRAGGHRDVPEWLQERLGAGQGMASPVAAGASPSRRHGSRQDRHRAERVTRAAGGEYRRPTDATGGGLDGSGTGATQSTTTAGEQ